MYMYVLLTFPMFNVAKTFGGPVEVMWNLDLSESVITYRNLQCMYMEMHVHNTLAIQKRKQNKHIHINTNKINPYQTNSTYTRVGHWMPSLEN